MKSAPSLKAGDSLGKQMAEINQRGGQLAPREASRSGRWLLHRWLPTQQMRELLELASRSPLEP